LNIKKQKMNNTNIKKVVLAYSGGLDTSIIVKWLQDTYQCEVITFTADIGQGEEVEPARAKAKAAGVEQIFIEDLREEFARDFVFPMFRANAIYEGEYLLGTSIARPLISKRLVEIAHEVGADAISHGATGKGNDQVRFELNAYALDADIQVIAPWREWELSSRESLMAYAESHGIEIDYQKQTKNPPIQWMRIYCTFLMKVTSWKTHGQSLKTTCGAGQCRLRMHLIKPKLLRLLILKAILLPLMVK
jgi:argininosuccinate synthase (EC 6.3.4.5)